MLPAGDPLEAHSIEFELEKFAIGKYKRSVGHISWALNILKVLRSMKNSGKAAA